MKGAVWANYLMSDCPGDHEPIPDPLKQPDKTALPLRQIVVTALLFLASLVGLTVFMNVVGIPRLQELAQSGGVIGPLAYITVKALAFVIAPLSSGPLQMASGPVFTIELAVLYTLIGDVIGGSINFLLARHAGRPVLLRLMDEATIARIDRTYRGRVETWQRLFIARIVFFFMWDVMSYAAGFTETIRFRTYLFVSVVAAIPTTIVTVTVSAELITDLRLLYIFAGVLLICLLLLFIFRKQIAVLYERFRQSSQQDHSDTPAS